MRKKKGGGDPSHITEISHKSGAVLTAVYHTAAVGVTEDPQSDTIEMVPRMLD